MRISDWSSDVCSSDLPTRHRRAHFRRGAGRHPFHRVRTCARRSVPHGCRIPGRRDDLKRSNFMKTIDISPEEMNKRVARYADLVPYGRQHTGTINPEVFEQLRSEEHTSELQSLMRISYAVFCLKKKKTIDK